MITALFIDWSFNPVAFTIPGIDLEIRYYGLLWALAIYAGARMFDHFCDREGLPRSVSESAFLYGALATIIGSRLGHCLFYEPSYFLSNPLEIITGIRNGGMASHGAAVGLLFGLWLFSRKNKLPLLWGLDRVMVAVSIGGAMVRFGNLMNSEIFGHPTTMPWGFRFLDSGLWQRVAAPLACHPTQIYEALCYIVTYIVLMVMYYRWDMGRKRPGVMFGAGLIGIFLTRFFIEFMKFEQVEFEQGMLLDMGQWLSIPFIALGVYMIVRGYKTSEVVVPKKR